MKPSLRGLLLLFGAAGVVGAYDAVTAYQKRGPPVTSTSALESPSAVRPRPASRAELETALATLEQALGPPTRDPARPWLLAEGVLAFGPEHRASDGRLALDLVASAAAQEERDARPIGPARFALLDVLLANGRGGELVESLRRAAKMPETDRDYHELPWLLSALTSARKLEPRDAGAEAGPDLGELTGRALLRLEVDQRVVESWAGPADHAFDEDTPLGRAKREKTGIYGHPSDGLPLLGAAAAAVALVGGEAERRRFEKQLGVLLYRYELERTAYASLLARHPEQGVLIRARQLELFAGLVETLGAARSLRLTDPGSEGGRRVDQVIRFAAADLALAVRGLADNGVFSSLDQLRAAHETRYRELVSDGCQAIHALRAALALV